MGLCPLSDTGTEQISAHERRTFTVHLWTGSRFPLWVTKYNAELGRQMLGQDQPFNCLGKGSGPAPNLGGPFPCPAPLRDGWTNPTFGRCEPSRSSVGPTPPQNDIPEARVHTDKCSFCSESIYFCRTCINNKNDSLI